MREEILKILLENSNDFVSGEEISNRLGVTRAAVWKHIKKLQKEGFRIESVNKKGYRIAGLPDKLDPVTVSDGLDTKRLGKKIEVHQELDSTNNRARKLALEDAPEGMLVISEEQTAGKGRMGRSWVSPPGLGIWMSLVLRPKIPPREAPRITAIAALAVAKALHKVTGLDLGIKWPNDIVFQGRKICGILTEIHADQDVIYYIVVGIGINANMLIKDFPKDIREKAISLREAKGEKVNRTIIIQQVIKELENIYLKYMEDRNFSSILDECRRFSATLGRRVTVIGTDSYFQGYALDFDEDGLLLVRKDDGKVERVLAGDVSVRGVEGYV